MRISKIFLAFISLTLLFNQYLQAQHTRKEFDLKGNVKELTVYELTTCVSHEGIITTYPGYKNYTVYKFNTLGNLTQKSRYFVWDSITNKLQYDETYTYGANNRLIKIEKKDTTGNSLSKSEYTYVSEVKYTVKMYEGSVLKTIETFLLNEKGKCTHIYGTDASGKALYTITYGYNSLDQLIRITNLSTANPNFQKYTTYYYSYNNGGQVAKEVYYNNKTLEHTYTFDYDSLGQKTFTNDVEQRNMNHGHTYTYDQLNNWTMQVTFGMLDRDLIAIDHCANSYRREIIYYE